MTDLEQGYKQNKAKLGLKHVRPWKWMPFTNPARKVKENKVVHFVIILMYFPDLFIFSFLQKYLQKIKPWA